MPIGTYSTPTYFSTELIFFQNRTHFLVTDRHCEKIRTENLFFFTLEKKCSFCGLFSLVKLFCTIVLAKNPLSNFSGHLHFFKKLPLIDYNQI